MYLLISNWNDCISSLAWLVSNHNLVIEKVIKISINLQNKIDNVSTVKNMQVYCTNI